MSSIMFELALKSTLDYHCNQIAQALRDSGDPDLASLAAGGLDDLVEIDATVKSKDPAILWEIHSFAEMPRDPLYTAQFSVGAKTTLDNANYLQAKLVSLLADHFKMDASITIKDYSVDVDELQAQEEKGVLLINEVASTPARFDNQSGLKLITVGVRLQRFV